MIASSKGEWSWINISLFRSMFLQVCIFPDAHLSKYCIRCYWCPTKTPSTKSMHQASSCWVLFAKGSQLPLFWRTVWTSWSQRVIPQKSSINLTGTLATNANSQAPSHTSGIRNSGDGAHKSGLLPALGVVVRMPHSWTGERANNSSWVRRFPPLEPYVSFQENG